MEVPVEHNFWTLTAPITSLAVAMMGASTARLGMLSKMSGKSGTNGTAESSRMRVIGTLYLSAVPVMILVVWKSVGVPSRLKPVIW